MYSEDSYCLLGLAVVKLCCFVAPFLPRFPDFFSSQLLNKGICCEFDMAVTLDRSSLVKEILISKRIFLGKIKVR